MRSAKDLALLLGFFLILIFILFGSKAAVSYLSYFLEDERDRHITELVAENERLRLELDNIVFENIVFREFDYVFAPVYSWYPFNDSSLIMVAAGSEDGIKEGMSVFTKDDIFVGRVEDVKGHVSEVKTIFDRSWSSGVAVGETGIEAVIGGGAVPSLSLIPEDAPVEEGDIVYNISPDYPINAVFGEIKEIFYNRGDIWQSAEIRVSYNLNKIRGVKIYTNFP